MSTKNTFLPKLAGLSAIFLLHPVCFAAESAIFPDGSIIASGPYSSNSTIYDYALVKYRADGSLDTTFDVDGRMAPGFGPALFGAAVATYPNGDFLVCGTDSLNGDGVLSVLAVAKFSSNGSPVTSFGVNGKKKISVSTVGTYGRSVEILNTGKIQVYGVVSVPPSSANPRGNSGTMIVQLNADGSTDTTFGTSGVTGSDFGGIEAVANGFSRQSDGKILSCHFGLSGGIFPCSRVHRIETNGDVDSNFYYLEKMNSIFNKVIQSVSGNIFIAGVGGSGIELYKLQSDGQIVTSFGPTGNGRAASTSPTADRGQDIALLADDSIIVVGESGAGSPDFIVAKYTTGGLLDSDFGSGGVQTVNFTEGVTSFDDSATGVLVQPDGKIVVTGISTYKATGQSVPNERRFSVVRLLANGQLDSSFGINGKMLSPGGAIPSASGTTGSSTTGGTGTSTGGGPTTGATTGAAGNDGGGGGGCGIGGGLAAVLGSLSLAFVSVLRRR
jgi:uncharacterized delta-60 repeat protein